MANLGEINSPYGGDLGTPTAMYSYLIGRGATKGEALMLTGAAANESHFNPDATHDGGVGYGMFGHNGSRLLAMRQYAQQNRAPLSDWRTQAGFALQELRSRPEGAAAAKATTPEQVALAQMYYERPQGFTENDPTQGHNWTGRLNTIRKFTALDPNATGAFAPSANPQIAGNMGTSPQGATGSGMAQNPFAGVGGDPALNQAIYNLVRQSTQQPGQGQRQPLIAQLLGTVTRPLHDALSGAINNLASPPALAPSGAAVNGSLVSAPPIPLSGAPATTQPPNVGAPAMTGVVAPNPAGNVPLPPPRPADLTQAVAALPSGSPLMGVSSQTGGASASPLFSQLPMGGGLMGALGGLLGGAA